MKKAMIGLLCLTVLTGCFSKEKHEDTTVKNNTEEINEVSDTESIDNPVEEDIIEKTAEEPTEKVEDQPQVNPPEQPTSAPIQQPSTKTETEVIPETAPIPEPEPELEPEKESITISIECTTILNNKDQIKAGYESFIPSNGVILNAMRMEIEEGDSVMSILKRACRQANINIVENSGYVKGINNIEEFTCGNLSGWMYSVNQRFVNASASKKEVSDGDVVRWMYTCDNGRDLYFER